MRRDRHRLVCGSKNWYILYRYAISVYIILILDSSACRAGNATTARPDGGSTLGAGMAHIAFAKANPGKLKFGSAGVEGLGHLSQELFQLMTRRRSPTCFTRAVAPS